MSRVRLTSEDVVKIREERAGGRSPTEIAAQFGISRSHLFNICVGYGWPEAGGPLTRMVRDKRRPVDDRFWEQVAKAGPCECWPWTGRLNDDGYGQFFALGGTILAHRYALELRLGRELLPDEVARHGASCTTRACCNGAHLTPGAIADNNRDTWERGRYAVGEASGTHRLTEAQVLEIRRRAPGAVFAELAREYGVSRQHIGRVVRGRFWRHVDRSIGIDVDRASLGASSGAGR